MEPASDESLVEQYRGASADARTRIADELFARHYERVARWCYRFTGDREAAADLHTFQGTSRFTTWLYSIARNQSLDRFQRLGAMPVDAGEDPLVAVPSLEPGPEEVAQRSSRSRQLHSFLADTLDKTERTVFTLHYGEDMPLDAITRLLRLDNTSGAKAYIVSAKRKLTRAVQRQRARGEVL